MIATFRVRWIVTIAILAAFAGVFLDQMILLQLAIACLLWVGLEWISFRYRVDSLVRRMSATRQILDQKGPARVMWVGRSVEVRTELKLPGNVRWANAFADIRELLPASTELVHGQYAVQSLLGLGHSATLTFRLRPTTVGAVRFFGLRIVLSDLHGFFHAEQFLPLPACYRVLPHPTEAGATRSVRKQNNELPPPGMHFVSRAGVGSELLEIRDYVPGDSPRCIAWKVSARRNKLMSKQYESEVPVRCHLLVDMSRSVRLGYPGPSQVNRLVNITATIAKMLVSHRDPVVLTLFDGQQTKVCRPSANSQTVLRMLDQLATAMDAPMPPVLASADVFMKPALDLARTCYPEALQQAESINDGFRWLPRRRKKRLRLQLAALLAGLDQLGPMAIGELVQNDQALSHRLQSFLASHHVPYPGPLTDATGRYLFEDGAKISQLANLLTKSVAQGHDNELFVIMAGLSDTDYQLQPLTTAIKVAIARHHRVVVLCAWPPRMEPPRTSDQNVLDRMSLLPADALARAANRQHILTSYQRLRRELGKLRVPVAAAADAQATRLVLDQLELVRGGRVVT